MKQKEQIEKILEHKEVLNELDDYDLKEFKSKFIQKYFSKKHNLRIEDKYIELDENIDKAIELSKKHIQHVFDTVENYREFKTWNSILKNLYLYKAEVRSNKIIKMNRGGNFKKFSNLNLGKIYNAYNIYKNGEQKSIKDLKEELGYSVYSEKGKAELNDIDVEWYKNKRVDVTVKNGNAEEFFNFLKEKYEFVNKYQHKKDNFHKIRRGEE